MEITEDELRTIWRLSRHRHRPWALVKTPAGKIQMVQHDQPYTGELLGIYHHPSLEDLREDFKVVTYG